VGVIIPVLSSGTGVPYLLLECVHYFQDNALSCLTDESEPEQYIQKTNLAPEVKTPIKPNIINIGKIVNLI